MADNLGGLAAQAGAGSQSLTSAFEELLKSQIANRPTPEERQGALNTYANAITSKGDTPEEWQVLLGGRLTAENPADPFQAARAALQYKLAWDKTQRETAKKENERAAKLQYDDITARQKSFDTEMAPWAKSVAARSSQAGKFVPVPGVAGVMVNNMNPTQRVDMRDAATRKQVQEFALKYTGLYDTDADALNAAFATVAALNAGTDAPISPDGAPAPAANNPARAPVPPANASAGVPSPSAAPDSGVPEIISDKDTSPLLPQHKRDFTYDVSKLSLDDRRMVQALIDRYRSNPNPGTEQATINEINKLLERGALQKVPAAQLSVANPPALPARKDKAEEAARIEYSKTEGGAMAKHAEDIDKTGYAARDLMGRLNLMERLTVEHGDTLPEGAGADVIQGIKSAAKSLGITVEGTGVGDVMASLGKQGALESRTANGVNLLPGSMSNYEDQLLQKIFPSLSFTKEGRLLQIQIAKAQLEQKILLSQVAREYARNKGRLDSGWREVADRYAEMNPFLNKKRIAALEEYARRLNSGKGS